MLETEAGQDTFDAMIARWLDGGLHTHDPPRVAGLARALGEIETLLWADAAEAASLTQDDILDMLGSAEARRARRLIDHLIAAGQLIWDTDAEAHWIERRRVRELRERAVASGRGALIEDYLRYLQDPNRPRSPRTIRMYLSAALGLMEHAGVTQAEEVTEDGLRSFMHQRRGQHANLMTFRTYVSQVTGQPLTLPGQVRKRSWKMRDRSLLGREKRMRRRMDGITTSAERRALAAVLISNRFGVALKDVLVLGRDDVTIDGDEVTVTVTVAGETLPLPNWLGAVLRKDIEAVGMWAFPGRGGMRPITPSSVWYHVRADGSGPRDDGAGDPAPTPSGHRPR